MLTQARTQALLRYALYLAFIFWGFSSYFLKNPGQDLASSYIGCRLIATGQEAHLYDHDPAYFPNIRSEAWRQIADESEMWGRIHPYVQTPLWAWSLQPLCNNLGFESFTYLFLLIALISTVAMVEITARTWAPRFLNAMSTGLLLTGIALSIPLHYTLWLVQTHPLFLALSIAALALAARNRSAAAGGVLAVAAAVKVTPALLALFWLVRGDWRAAAWFALLSAALLLATLAGVGQQLTIDYWHSMQRVSDTLIVSFNNQSLIAWMAFSEAHLPDFLACKSLVMPTWLKLTALAASVAGAVLLGRIARSRPALNGASGTICLVCLTIFGPIAWTHYYLALIPAVMLLIQHDRRIGIVVAGIVLALNCSPPVPTPIMPDPEAFLSATFHYAHLLSAGIVIAAFFWLAHRRRTT